MARKPVSVFKRPGSKGQFRYYVKVWDDAAGRYWTARSAAALACELGLDEKPLPPSTRPGAFLIGMEYGKRESSRGGEASLLLADYWAEF